MSDAMEASRTVQGKGQEQEVKGQEGKIQEDIGGKEQEGSESPPPPIPPRKYSGADDESEDSNGKAMEGDTITA